MQTEYPFSSLFGRADSRDACIASSAKIYERLVNIQEVTTNLQFSTLAEIAMDNRGQIIQKKMKRLIDVFRPNKDKELSLLDFTRVRMTVTSAVALFRYTIFLPLLIYFPSIIF
jgi:hypothetical protein